MELAGIFDGDLLVVDRSLSPKHNDVVIASVENQEQFACKIFDLKNQLLVPASSCHTSTISCSEGVMIEGVVTSSIRMHRPNKNGLK